MPASKRISEADKAAIAAFNAVGWIAFYHPRSDTVSINGFPRKPRADAMKRIRELLARKESDHASH